MRLTIKIILKSFSIIKAMILKKLNENVLLALHFECNLTETMEQIIIQTVKCLSFLEDWGPTSQLLKPTTTQKWYFSNTFKMLFRLTQNRKQKCTAFILVLTQEILWCIFDCILTRSMDLYGSLKLEPSHGIDV